VQGVVKKDRLFGAIVSSTKSVLITFGRTFYAFWLQMTGLLFIFFTMGGIGALIKQYHTHFANHKDVAIAGIFTFVCFCFTVQSFVKARKTLKRR
jgi:hypothetical protein